MNEEIVIDRRFCGPPSSGNGGYVAGRLAACIEGTARVRLHRPPPLGTPLRVDRRSREVALLDGDEVVARAVPASVDYEPPPSPSRAEAEAASRRYVGFDEHVFPTCFVCGPQRAPGEGLRIFAGRLDGTGRAACPWIPDPSLAGADGRVAAEFVWAALDCPGAFTFPALPKTPVVLGELAVDIRGEIRAGEHCVLAAEELHHEGRKHRTVTMLYGETGDCRAVGLATWIELPAA